MFISCLPDLVLLALFTNVGEEELCLHPEFIPNSSPVRINVWRAPGPAKQGAEKSERRDPMR